MNFLLEYDKLITQITIENSKYSSLHVKKLIERAICLTIFEQ